MEKTLRVLIFLSGPRAYTCPEIAEYFEVTERTIYRMLNKMDNAGFVVERRNGTYRLAQNIPQNKSLNKLFHFSEEEAWIIFNAIAKQNIKDSTVKNLITKLHTLYNFKSLNKVKEDAYNRLIGLISKAMDKKRVILLKNYRSSSSLTIKNRKVEAFKFLPDYEGIFCFDWEDGKVKTFKISRIQNIEISDEKWVYEREHQSPFIDAFRMSADQPLARVNATLSLMAYNLIIEEFPLVKPFLKARPDHNWKLNIDIAKFEGIGRFVLSLPGEVKVHSPEAFINYLKSERNKYKY